MEFDQNSIVVVIVCLRIPLFKGFIYMSEKGCETIEKSPFEIDRLS